MQLTPLAALVTLAGCDGSTTSAETRARLSHVDGRPVVEMSTADFAAGRGAVAEALSELVGAGSATVDALNTARDAGATQVALHTLSTTAGKQGGFPHSTHFALHEDGAAREVEVVLALEAPAAALSKQHAHLNATSTYVALDPDAFHAPENVEGATVYPYTFLAHALDGSGRTLTMRVSGPGQVHAEGLGKAAEPDVAYVTPVATSAALPGCEEADPSGGLPVDCDGGDSGGGGVGPPPPGDPADDAHYLELFRVRLNADMDDGNEEVFAFRQVTDDYDNVEFSKVPAFRFDAFNAQNSGDCRNLFGGDTWNLSAEAELASSGFRTWYEVPDINLANVDYSFAGIRRCGDYAPGPSIIVDVIGGPPRPRAFPVQVLGELPYRYVLTEDDYDNSTFTQRRRGGWSGYVQTFNMSNGFVQGLYTRINANSTYTGTGDDVYLSSGLRDVRAQTFAARFSSGGRMSSDGTYKLFDTDAGGFQYTLGSRTL